MNFKNIVLRPVTEHDKLLIFRWVNDCSVRKMFFHSEPISWEEHRAWFDSKIVDQNHVYYIALNENKIPVGQIRFGVNILDADVSVLIAPEFRKKGFGTEIIKCGTQLLFSNTSVSKVHAYIKLNNYGSYKAFLNAGYSDIGETIYEGHKVYHMVQKKDKISVIE